MKHLKKSTFLLASAALSLAATTQAAEVSTTPVGYVSHDIADDADLLVGVPLTTSSAFAGSVLSVANGVVTVDGGGVPDLSSSAHYLIITTPEGALEGQWFSISSSDGATVTVAEDLQTAGLAATDTFSIFPFWTLDSLLPSGGGIPASSDVFAPSGTVIFNDITHVGTNPGVVATYLYHDGSQGDEGWYDVNNLGDGLVGDTVISPESFITIRNRSGGIAKVTFSGTVPSNPFANEIISRTAGRQDNLIPNPYPTSFTLADSELVSSGVFSVSSDVFAPTDRLQVFAVTGGSLRPSPDVTFIYHDGTQGDEGWYDVDNLGDGVQNSYQVPAGAALVIRKAAGADAALTWAPSLPYSL